MMRLDAGFCLLLAVGLSANMAACASARPTNGTAAASSTSVPSEVGGDARVQAILVRACYGCHSTEGTTPWYAALAPTHLAAGSARKVLNFSAWTDYDTQMRANELAAIAQSVSSGSMPPGDYTVFDHSARLSPDEKSILINWASQPTRSAQ